MNSEIRFIDKLRDRHIPGNADELIRLMPRESFRARQKIHHLLNRGPGRNCQIRIGGHADEVGGRFRARPRKLHAFTHGELNAAAKRRFNCGLIDFTITLRGMPVANFKQCSRNEHRNEQRRSRNELFIIQIARM